MRKNAIVAEGVPLKTFNSPTTLPRERLNSVDIREGAGRGGTMDAEPTFVI